MSQDSNALRAGFELDDYRIESVLGTGGFGITYKARDIHLDTWVAIKEYFPVEWSYRAHDGIEVCANAQGQAIIGEVKASGYEWGLSRFLDEARVLAKVQHPYVVRVRRYFRKHGTAYIVMDFEEGEPLSALLRREETLSEADLRGMLEEILPALQAVHEQGYLHRDIKPSNLYVRSRDGCVMLIDFGAARQSLSRRSKSVTGLVTPGYSPPEQYVTRSDRYGPWTDIYALGAVLYRCITGRAPPEAPDRQMWDTMLPAVEAGAGRYSEDLLKVIDRALAMRPEDRFQTIAEMQASLRVERVTANDKLVTRRASDAPVTVGVVTRPQGDADSGLPFSAPSPPIRASSQTALSPAAQKPKFELDKDLLTALNLDLSAKPTPAPSPLLDPDDDLQPLELEPGPLGEKTQISKPLDKPKTQQVPLIPDLEPLEPKSLPPQPVAPAEPLLPPSRSRLLQNIKLQDSSEAASDVTNEAAPATPAAEPHSRVLHPLVKQEPNSKPVRDPDSKRPPAASPVSQRPLTKSPSPITTVSEVSQSTFAAEPPAIIHDDTPRSSISSFFKVKSHDITLSTLLVILLTVVGVWGFLLYQSHQQAVDQQRAEQARQVEQQQQLAEAERRQQIRQANLHQELEGYVRQAQTALANADLATAERLLAKAVSLKISSPLLSRLQAEFADAQSRQIRLTVEVEPRINMPFVHLPGGCFQMGSPESETERFANEIQRQACIQSFLISKHEVTNAQYRLFRPMHDSGTYAKRTLNDDNQPVVEVSWFDATAYARWLSEQTGRRYRLPTEAEWEYAARGQAGTARFWGDDSSGACRYASVADLTAQRVWGAVDIHGCEDGQPVAAPVASFLPNAFQLHDMLGNASEWTCSEFVSDYGGHELRCATDDINRNPQRVVRGGSWDDAPRYVRSADRNGRNATTRSNDLGFRLVREN